MLKNCNDPNFYMQVECFGCLFDYIWVKNQVMLRLMISNIEFYKFNLSAKIQVPTLNLLLTLPD